MDRRTAIRQAAAAGMATAGYTAIASQPAFAYASPVITGPPNITVTTTSSLTARINLAPPSVSCPASAVSTPTPTLVSLSQNAYWPGGNRVMSSGTGTTVSINGYGQWYPDDRIRVTVVYQFQCVYAGRTVTICAQWYREFRSSTYGASTSWSLVSSTGPTIVSCPGSSPAAAPKTRSLPVSGGRPLYP